MCLLLSPPVQSLQGCKYSHGRRPTAGAQLIPATKHSSSHIPATTTAHPTSQPQPQPPSYQAQLNTTGKCEQQQHACVYKRLSTGAWCRAWHVSKRTGGQTRYGPGVGVRGGARSARAQSTWDLVSLQRRYYVTITRYYSAKIYQAG